MLCSEEDDGRREQGRVHASARAERLQSSRRPAPFDYVYLSSKSVHLLVPVNHLWKFSIVIEGVFSGFKHTVRVSSCSSECDQGIGWHFVHSRAQDGIAVRPVCAFVDRATLDTTLIPVFPGQCSRMSVPGCRGHRPSTASILQPRFQKTARILGFLAIPPSVILL